MMNHLGFLHRSIFIFLLSFPYIETNNLKSICNDCMLLSQYLFAPQSKEVCKLFSLLTDPIYLSTGQLLSPLLMTYNRILTLKLIYKGLAIAHLYHHLKRINSRTFSQIKLLINKGINKKNCGICLPSFFPINYWNFESFSSQQKY